MGAEQVVQFRYGQAVAEPPSEVAQYGQSAVYDEHPWTIYSQKALGASVLGQGPTEEDAWKNAAEKLLTDMAENKEFVLDQDQVVNIIECDDRTKRALLAILEKCLLKGGTIHVLLEHGKKRVVAGVDWSSATLLLSDTEV